MQRRTALQIVTAGLAAPQAMPAQTHAHTPAHMPATAPAANKSPVFFNAAQYELLRALVGTIVPADGGGGDAIEAGVPELIDLLASENAEYQRQLSGGLLWLDTQCQDLYGAAFVHAAEPQRREILDRIAYRRNAEHNPVLAPGIAFFALLRDLTLDGYFTGRGGIEYLGFRGNQPRREFTGCPPAI
jgi:hypothetical protein